MHVRPFVILVLIPLSACAFGMRAGVRGGKTGGEVTGDVAIGLGRAGTVAILLEPEVMVGAGHDGAVIGGGTGFDVLLEAPSSRIGVYAGPHFLATYDGRGALRSGVELGLLLVPLRSHHNYDPPAEKGGFIFDDVFRSETRRVQLGLSVRYDKIERFDDVTPDETQVLFGATVSWTAINGYTAPARDTTPSRPMPKVALPRSQVVETVIDMDPEHALAALLDSFGAPQPGVEIRIRSRQSVEWVGSIDLPMYDEQTGATIRSRIDISYTLAAAGTGTRITAFVTGEPGDEHGPEAVMLWARRFRDASEQGYSLRPVELDPHPRMRVLIDTRSTPMHARAGDCMFDPALAADAIESVFAVVVTPTRSDLGVMWMGAATQIKPPAMPALGLFDVTVNFGLGQPWCTSTEAARADELVRVDGGGSYPRTVAAARDDAAAFIEPTLSSDTEARRKEAIEAVTPYAGGFPVSTTVIRGDSATWLTDPDRVRFTFVESVRADDISHVNWAAVNRIIVVDVDLGSTTATPTIVSDTVERAEGADKHG